MPWIVERIHPLMAVLSPDDAAIAVRLVALEHLTSGTTAWVDPEVPVGLLDRMAEAAVTTRMRIALAASIDSAPGYGLAAHSANHRHASHAGDAAGPAVSQELIDPVIGQAIARWHRAAGGRLSILLGPRATSALTPDLGAAISRMTESAATGVTFHCAEVPEDVAAVRGRADLGPIAFADAIGLLGPRSILAHGVHLEPGEYPLLAERGATLVHCPTSNAKLGSGIADLVGLREAGVRIALGTDGGTSNDSYDLLAEARLAGLLAKAARRDPAAMTPERLLGFATVGGAAAIGLAGGGRIEPGAPADLAVWSLRQPGSWPTVDPIDTLVFGSRRAIAEIVLVAGEVLLADGRPVGVDLDELWSAAEDASHDALRRSGIERSIRPAWWRPARAGRRTDGRLRAARPYFLRRKRHALP